MTGKKLFGGAETKSEDRVSIIPRLPPVIPNISTGRGSFLNVTPTFATSGQQIGEIRAPGPNVPITNRGALAGLDINLGFAPEIDEIRAETLGGRRNLLSNVQGDIETLRGLQNPFIRARVQPFIEQRERAARQASRRGVTGPLSALATNPFTRQIADQTALATAEAQTAIRSGQSLAQSLLTDISGEGQQLLAEELAALGLGNDVIQTIIASQLERPTVTSGASKTTQQRGITQGFGDIFPGIR